ncbi:hypothetical protein [Komagataeibacter europaeus]|uniref:hypothetical protein n=1 Tax=Komagataeibacter europaeus TaxID=33995 RepID=UPI0015FD19E1|nr:hypothetical protein [Komagataeibacter europaeus]
MCSSEGLIHDARQITLEEMIMTNETPMYLVKLPITEKQEADLLLHDIAPDDVLEAITNIGTPIQPCADVETVGWVNPTLLIEILGGVLSEMALSGCETPIRTIPLVRRTDMEAQVARVAAEKDAEIARLRKELQRIADNAPAPSYAQHFHNIARAALNEGAAV